MKIGDTTWVQANYSVTKSRAKVEILKIDDLSFFIKYETGYTEWLPITAFENY